jgi:hypothetical protein
LTHCAIMARVQPTSFCGGLSSSSPGPAGVLASGAAVVGLAPGGHKFTEGGLQLSEMVSLCRYDFISYPVTLGRHFKNVFGLFLKQTTADQLLNRLLVLSLLALLIGSES